MNEYEYLYSTHECTYIKWKEIVCFQVKETKVVCLTGNPLPHRNEIAILLYIIPLHTSVMGPVNAPCSHCKLKCLCLMLYGEHAFLFAFKRTSQAIKHVRTNGDELCYSMHPPMGFQH